MDIVNTKATQHDKLRRKILESAREIFINDGYGGFSMQKLAEKIDCPPATIHRYFETKDDLLFAIREEIKDDLLFAICEGFFSDFFARLNHIRSLSQHPVETLRQAFLYLVDFGLKNPDQYRIIFFTKSVYGTFDQFVEKESMARSTYLAFKEMVRDCIKAGRLQEFDDDAIALAMVAASHGLVSMVLHRPEFLDGKRDMVAAYLVYTLLRGYQK